MNKYIELIDGIKKIAKKDWTEPESGNYVFEIQTKNKKIIYELFEI